MASSKLRATAPEFVPQATSHFYYGSYDPAIHLEEAVTSEELEELEACEEWVRTMADLDEMEREHLIATALSEAEPSQILEVEMRAMAVEAEEGKRKVEPKRKGGKH
ncbi:hypothetical protein GPECTOR_8g238 [Gonium pectorale]|uniref:Ataxin-2 C-terminal domain-containing protein n=1 Tax=Gonium pectorale TaxID=33097 RepID=A0A150GSM4_GONPE|nr:hypothetical protein GPECTOR_8g238 [Gonium pectorale]|eukprot:KXZ52856.1 hypothetical protein GPECTOR_8g238 [Gonium pectorale]